MLGNAELLCEDRPVTLGPVSYTHLLHPVGAAKTLVGEPPQTRHFGTSCPEVCCLRHRCLSLLFLIFALVRQAEQMIDIRLDRHGLPHFLLGRPVLGIEGFFSRCKFAAFFF